jgi:hypothetical protein
VTEQNGAQFLGCPVVVDMPRGRRRFDSQELAIGVQSGAEYFRWTLSRSNNLPCSR